MAEPGAIVRKSDFPVQPGHPTLEVQRKWMLAAVPYRNYAGRDTDLDNRVQQWASGNREAFYQRMHGTMEQWAVNWAAANGESLWGEFEDDVHVPEAKKALDGKVARIEEAIFGFDPPFACDGADGQLARWKAKLAEAYTWRQMQLAKMPNLVQPCARDAELCNIAAIRLSWDVQEDYIVDRKMELRFDKDGKPYYHDERRMRRAIVKSGIKAEIVDPFLFVYDLDVDDPDDGAFIGHESEPFWHEIEARVKDGTFSEANWKRLERSRGETGKALTADGAATSYADQLRQSRSIAQSRWMAGRTASRHEPMRCRLLEMWGWFDFGDGFEGVNDPLGQRITGCHRVKVIIVNGVVLEFRLNPFDKKFHPYAVCRINRNGHEMVAPPQFSSVVQVNAQYDRVQSNILRNLDLSVAPQLVVGTESDLPDSILGSRPGTVWRQTGPVDIIKVPDVSSQVQYYHQFFRREIEETSGSLRVFESPQGTATETERKVQEQQRMVRNSIRANAELWRQVAQKTFWMSGQFATGPQRFRVIGKASKVLGEWAEITPDILQENVDFRFVGLDNIHVLGNQRAGMAQWMTRWGPMLQAIPEVNLPQLCKLDFELSVGKTLGDEVFDDVEPEWELWTQDEENAMLLAGLEVRVSRRDNHQEHIQQLDSLLKRPDLPGYVRARALKHGQEHMKALIQQLAQQEAQMKEAQRQARLQSPFGDTPGVDAAPKAGGMQQPSRGQTNGPDQARTAAKPGREPSGGNSQSQRVEAGL